MMNVCVIVHVHVLPVYTHTVHVRQCKTSVSVYLLLLHVPGAIFFYVYENQR